MRTERKFTRTQMEMDTYVSLKSIFKRYDNIFSPIQIYNAIVD